MRPSDDKILSAISHRYTPSDSPVEVGAAVVRANCACEEI